MTASDRLTKAEPRSAKDRLYWADAAKGISILLVVLLHAVAWSEYVVNVPEWLGATNDALAPLRMPLFFCISGIFAAKWMTEPWQDTYGNKLALLVWTFLIWQPIVFSYKLMSGHFLPNQPRSEIADHLLRLAVTVVRPNGELWFLWALVLFIVTAKWLHRIPRLLQVASASVVSAVWYFCSDNYLTPDQLRAIGDGWDGALGLFVFFLAGLLYRDEIKKWVAKTPVSVSAGLMAVAGVALWGYYIADLSGYFALPLAIRVIGLACGIGAAVVFSRISVIRYWGTVTLPIYLGHTAIIAISCSILAVTLDDLPAGNRMVGVLFPLFLAAFAIFVSLQVYRLRNSRIGFYLYNPPNWFIRSGSR
ncbi:acyltransferase family protein [Rhodococcus sp. NPDC060086]|uniref:acyltransferase family protein n=1 Tax=Rhodococcus sp. NPDC060086 TaxID=3347055 RepID=UPI00364B0CC1